MNIQEKIREIMLSEELSDSEKLDQLHATLAQLRQLKVGLAVTQAMQQIRRAELLAKERRAIHLKTSATQGDVGGFDEGRDAVAYLKPHVLHRACGDDGNHVADGGLDDDLTQHLVRDYLPHGAGYFVANRLFHKVIVLFHRGLRNSGLTCHLHL